jgi:YidC/Oxa1 family membrane protein insertase
MAPFIALGPGKRFSFTLYAGPLKKSVMAEIEPTLVEAIDIGMAWRKAISAWIFAALAFLHSLFKNYGLAIIGLALMVKLVTLPFQHKSLKSMEDMRRIQPLMKEIQEKYKDNPQKQQAELMKLYKEHNVNPLGGCLPMILQMPVFFALYPVLKNSIELRNASFVFWLKDLSMPDPYYILPILMGFFMFLQQKISVVDEKQKAMMYIMPVFFTIFFMNFPSGLVLYWMVFNILSIAHQLLLNKGKEKTN